MYRPKLALIVLTISCLGLVHGCKDGSMSNSSETTNKMADDSGEYAKVNDVVISNNDFQQYAKPSALHSRKPTLATLPSLMK